MSDERRDNDPSVNGADEQPLPRREGTHLFLRPSASDEQIAALADAIVTQEKSIWRQEPKKLGPNSHAGRSVAITALHRYRDDKLDLNISIKHADRASSIAFGRENKRLMGFNVIA